MNGDDPGRWRDRGSDRLLLDVMLGKLATYLRMCGYDADYALDRGLEADDEILAAARADGRTLLTRNRGLAARLEDAVLLGAKDVDDQLRELTEAGFALELADRPRRCSRCNGRLEPVERGAETPDYAPDVGETDQWRCVDCGQVFWKGSHWDAVAERLRALE